MKNEPSIVYRDFFVDALVADESLKQWQSEIGKRRELLQSYVCTHSFAKSPQCPIANRHDIIGESIRGRAYRLSLFDCPVACTIETLAYFGPRLH
jgi:hypothetical protein